MSLSGLTFPLEYLLFLKISFESDYCCVKCHVWLKFFRRLQSSAGCYFVTDKEQDLPMYFVLLVEDGLLCASKCYCRQYIFKFPCQDSKNCNSSFVVAVAIGNVLTVQLTLSVIHFFIFH